MINPISMEKTLEEMYKIQYADCLRVDKINLASSSIKGPQIKRNMSTASLVPLFQSSSPHETSLQVHLGVLLRQISFPLLRVALRYSPNSGMPYAINFFLQQGYSDGLIDNEI
jgi:hypothetical protein